MKEGEKIPIASPGSFNESDINPKAEDDDVQSQCDELKEFVIETKINRQKTESTNHTVTQSKSTDSQKLKLKFRLQVYKYLPLNEVLSKILCLSKEDNRAQSLILPLRNLKIDLWDKNSPNFRVNNI